MPHYQDGTEARVGDRVRGHGYNLVDRERQPLEIEGIVVDVRAGADAKGACTLTVAYLRNGMSPSGHLANGVMVQIRGYVRVELEYGDTVGFTKLPEPHGY